MVTAPKHGDERNFRMETTSYVTPGHTLDGVPVPMGHSTTQSTSEKYCATCNAWILVKGVMGGLTFMFEHAPGHGAPAAR